MMSKWSVHATTLNCQPSAPWRGTIAVGVASFRIVKLSTISSRDPMATPYLILRWNPFSLPYSVLLNPTRVETSGTRLAKPYSYIVVRWELHKSTRTYAMMTTDRVIDPNRAESGLWTWVPRPDIHPELVKVFAMKSRHRRLASTTTHLV